MCADRCRHGDVLRCGRAQHRLGGRLTSTRHADPRGYQCRQEPQTTQHSDDANNLIATTDARGHRTDFGYDANGNTVEVVQPLIASSMGDLRPTSTYSYDHSATSSVTAIRSPMSGRLGGALWPTTSAR